MRVLSSIDELKNYKGSYALAYAVELPQCELNNSKNDQNLDKIKNDEIVVI